MTREEAIHILENLKPTNTKSSFDAYVVGKAIAMAIKALEQEPKYCDRNICLKNEYNGIGCDECEVTKSQEPCEDCISRAEAEALFREARINLNPKMYKSADEFNTRDLMLLNAEQMIHLLPSVQPKPIECEDCISREAFITRYREWSKSEYGKIPSDDALGLRVAKSLPSIQPIMPTIVITEHEPYMRGAE